MHPMKDSAISGHSAKLHRMTRDYGAADPKANILGPTNRGKAEGPEEAVEFGADSDQPRARSDRKSRRTMAANPVATYAKGGAVKRARGGKVKHRDAGGNLGADIEAANVQQSLANPQKRAAGGRTKHKGKGSTHVNVIVAPGGGAPGAPGAGAMPMMPPRPPMMPPAMPPHPPMAAPGMPPGAPGGAMPPAAMAPHPGLPPGAGMAVGTTPPGLPPGVPPAALAAMMQPRASGGAVSRAKGGKVHADAEQDKGLIEKTLRDEGLVRRERGGSVKQKMPPMRHHHMTAGAVTGIGRLEKIGEKPKDAGPAQKV